MLINSKRHFPILNHRPVNSMDKPEIVVLSSSFIIRGIKVARRRRKRAPSPLVLRFCWFPRLLLLMTYSLDLHSGCIAIRHSFYCTNQSHLRSPALSMDDVSEREGKEPDRRTRRRGGKSHRNRIVVPNNGINAGTIIHPPTTIILLGGRQ